MTHLPGQTQNTGHRNETVHIQMLLDKAASIRHELALTVLKCLPAGVELGDALRVSYEFNVHYFDDIVSKLRAVIDLCNDPAIVISEIHEELQHGECVIEDAILALRRLKVTLEQRR